MYLRKIAFVLLILLIPFSMAKAPDRSAAHSYNAGGHVYDDQGFALEGVVVNSGSIENITNKDGYYLITGLSDGTYNFSYSKTGYDTGYLKVGIRGKDVVNPDKTLYKTASAPQPTPQQTSTVQPTSDPKPKSTPQPKITPQPTVSNPLDVDLKLIEPGLIDDNGTKVETWHDAKTGHFGKLIGYSSTFKNTGNSSLVVKVTEFYNNKSYDNNSFTVTLAGNETKPCQNRVSGCRLAFEIEPAGVKDGVFNFTLQMNVQVYSGSSFIFNYTNSTTVSLPIIPVYRIKRADGGMVIVTEGGTTRVTYTLEANSTVNLTGVSIYDPFYPGRFFNISSLEANNPRNISFSYPATTADLSKFKCEEPYSSCIMNIATLTAKTESGNTITDTDYVRLPLCRDTDKDCLAGAAITRQVGTSSSRGGGGGGGGGIAPSEDIGNIERREVREMDVLSKVSSAFVFRAADPVLVVTFESSASESEVPVSVEVLKSRSKNIKDDAPGKLYKYFNVFAGTSGFSKKVSNGVVAFRVNNSWLEENGLDPEDISMYKWQGGWVKKETQIAERRSNYTYYASLTGNFSSFAIVGVKRPEIEIPVSNASAEESIKNTTQISAYSNFSGAKQPGGFLELSAAFVLAGGAMGGVYYLRRNRKI